MTSIRSRGAAVSLVALIVILALAGCGGSTASTGTNSSGADTSAGDGDGNGNGNGNGDASSAPAVTPGGGQGGSDDAEQMGGQLVPPNSTEVSRTLAGNYWYASYISSDSPDSLKAYYDDKIPSLGLTVISTTTAGGAHSWLVATDESGSFGGSVTVGPPPEGDSGSSVVVGIGSS